ncbi:TonB-dependent siderophore receptor [Ochrobactrum sp. S1502_03]|uniref:TonB-dependent siderophore receptor n=1 Tax=Ochrobactrum sp. S1502_03 TaxID=3108451 RepID=UPI0037C841B6
MRRIKFILAVSTALTTPVFAQEQAETILEPIIIEATGGKGVTETTAGDVQGYRALTAASATKTATPIERIPQNIQVIPRKLLDDQSANSVSEALKNVSSVQPQDSRSIGNVEQVPMRIRGFGAERLTDGYPGNLFGAGDRDGLVNVERIEVLKGPNAILYGGGAGAPVGGVVNVISKLPSNTASYEIGGRMGSYGYWSPYFDVNQPLYKDGTALFRMTGEYTGADSFIDVLESKRYSLNPTLTLTNNDTTSLTIQAFMSNHKQQAYPGVPVYGTILGDVRFNDRLFFGDPDIEPSHAKQHGVTATFDHEFNDVWSTNIKARWSKSEINQLAQAALMDPTGTGGFPAIPPSTFDVNNMEHFDEQREFSFNPTVQAKFSAGPTENVLLFGADYARTTDKGFMTMGLVPGVVDLENPIFPRYTRPVIGVDGMAFFDFDVNYVTKGVYGQLQSSIYDRVHVLLGGRFGSLDVSYDELSSGTPVNYKTEKTKFLPRAGVMVDVLDGLSVYANYSEGMKWVPFSTFVSQPEPELSKSLESGIKFNVNDALTGTLAVFQIDRENVPYQISPGVGGVSEQRSRGFEADILYQHTPNWSILASYGYTNAKFVDATSTVAADTRVPMVPEHSGRLWVNYEFGPNFMPGWSAGAGIYAASDQTINAQYDWKTDGYFTIDAKIGYENEKMRASLSVQNLTGEKYFTPYTWFGGQVAPGAPRTVYAQLGFKL